MKKKVTVSWSGGKDSAFALYQIVLAGEYEVISLHTVFNAETKRVGMHGIHETLIEAQASLLGIPLEKLFLEPSESHDAYTSLMKDYYAKCSLQGVNAVVFGDIFLEDLRIFRDGLLSAADLAGIYPLWQLDTKILIHDFVNLGFKTLICAANANYFPQTVMGASIDLNFVSAVPRGVDPCGENGEFHTFVYDGPIFSHPLRVKAQETVQKEYSFTTLDNHGNPIKEKIFFWFCEVSL